MDTPWLVPWHPAPETRPVLLCLPPAGAGCARYRAWQSSAGPDIAVVGVQLPGRETRWNEPPASSMDDVVAAVTAGVLGLTTPDRPLVVFGHSFGGLLGYEIVRSLGQQGRTPAALVVAACGSPHEWVGAGRGLLDDDATLGALLDDAPRVGELDEDTQEIVLDLLRQDARLSMTYRDPGGARVAADLEVWGGRGDSTVDPRRLDGWRPYAAASFRRREFPGGHHFCTERADVVVPALLALTGGKD